MNHCCAVWDSCGKTDRDYQTGCIYEHLISLTGVNKKILTGSTFSWPSLENCRKFHTCLQVFKCIHGLALAYLLNELSLSLQYHAYNTRSSTFRAYPWIKHLDIKDPFTTNMQRRGILLLNNHET